MYFMNSWLTSQPHDKIQTVKYKTDDLLAVGIGAWVVNYLRHFRQALAVYTLMIKERVNYPRSRTGYDTNLSSFYNLVVPSSANQNNSIRCTMTSEIGLFWGSGWQNIWTALHTEPTQPRVPDQVRYIYLKWRTFLLLLCLLRRLLSTSLV